MVINALAVTLMLITGLSGFWPVFGEPSFIRPAVIGLLAGTVVAWLGWWWRWLTGFVAAGVAVAYLALGTVAAVPQQGIAQFIPTRASMTSVVFGSVRIWRQFVTVTAPVDAFTGFTLVPFIVALVGAATALSLVWRARNAALALVPVAVVLIVVAALGASSSFHPVIQGVVAGVVAATWLVWRPYSRTDSFEPAPVTRQRWRNAAVLLCSGVLVAGVAGAQLEGDHRNVLRTHIAAPLMIHDYPSPLESFRPLKDTMANQTLFTVSNWTNSLRLRLAVMDSYDGWVYTVSDATGTSRYLRVGPELAGGAVAYGGTSQTISLQVGSYGDIWLPTISALDSIHFTGGRITMLTDGLYYNSVTDAGIEPDGLVRGDAYTVNATVQATMPTDGTPAMAVTVPKPQNVPDMVSSLAAVWTTGVKTALGRVNAIVARLHDQGFYSDGLGDQVPSLPGHSAARITSLLADPTRMVGDDEQYAVTAALMLQSLGMPARVVMGFTTDEDSMVGGSQWTVTGKDAHVWIEVPFQGFGWVPFVPTPDKGHTPMNTTEKPQAQPLPQVIQPPPPGSDQGQTQTRNQADQQQLPAPKNTHVIPWGKIAIYGTAIGGPLIAVLGPLLVIGLIKRRRRINRQFVEQPSQSVIGGWQEILDRAADLGTVIPAAATRSQSGEILSNRYGIKGLHSLAAEADGGGFSPDEPSLDSVDAFWERVYTVSRELRRSASPWAKYRAAVSLTSLRKFPRPTVSLDVDDVDDVDASAQASDVSLMPSVGVPKTTSDEPAIGVALGAGHVSAISPMMPAGVSPLPTAPATTNSSDSPPKSSGTPTGFIETTW